MSEEFFLEIGTEEIPARFLPDAMKNLEELLKKEFEKNRLSYGIIRTFSTPRRICALVEELSSYQDDLIVEKMGPAKKVAFDINGNPLKPALGFAKSQGLKVDDLIVKETPRGEYVFAIKKIKGKEASEVLKTILFVLFVLFTGLLPYCQVRLSLFPWKISKAEIKPLVIVS